jgi:hypothetical protein
VRDPFGCGVIGSEGHVDLVQWAAIGWKRNSVPVMWKHQHDRPPAILDRCLAMQSVATIRLPIRKCERPLVERGREYQLELPWANVGSQEIDHVMNPS